MKKNIILLAAVFCAVCAWGFSEEAWRTEALFGATFEVPDSFRTIDKMTVGYCAGDEKGMMQVYGVGMGYDAYGQLLKRTCREGYVTESTVNGCNMYYAENEEDGRAVFIAASEADYETMLVFSYSEPLEQRESAKERAKDIFVRIKLE